MEMDNQSYDANRELENETQHDSRYNGNTNDLDSRSHSRDNSGMHAGNTKGSSYRRQESSENANLYGSKNGSYWESAGSDRQQSIGSRMNEQHLNQKK